MRAFVNEHRVAAAIVGLAVIALAVWKVMVGAGLGGPATVPPAPLGLPAAKPAGQVATGPTRGAPAAATTPSVAGTSGPAGGNSVDTGTMSRSLSPGSGRPDPFAPVAPAGTAAAPSSGPGVPLPPVPPLLPAGAEVPGTAAAPRPPVESQPARPGAQLRLAGILDGPVALAIISDAGTSYIVRPGDAVVSGVRLVAIDVDHRSVTLAWDNQSWQLPLGGGTTQ